MAQPLLYKGSRPVDVNWFTARSGSPGRPSGLSDVGAADLGRAVEVDDGARDAEHAVVAAGGEVPREKAPCIKWPAPGSPFRPLSRK
jgi:hypothetical protein